MLFIIVYSVLTYQPIGTWEKSGSDEYNCYNYILLYKILINIVWKGV